MDKKIKEIIKLDHGNKLLLFLLMLLSVIQSIAIPFVIVDYIDIIIEAKSMKDLIICIGIYLLLSILGMVLDMVFEYYVSLEEFNFTQKLRCEVQSELFQKNGDFYDNEKAGELLLIVCDDTAKIASFVYKFYSVVMSLLQAVAILCVLLYYDLKLTIILFVMIPVTLVTQKYFENKLHEAAILNRNDYGNINGLTEEFVSNAVEMIASGYRNYFLQKYEKLSKYLHNSFSKLVVTNILSNQALQLVTMITMALITCIGGYHVFAVKISMGVLVVFLQYCPKFIGPFENLILLKINFNLIRPSVDRVSSIIENKREEKECIERIDEIIIDGVDFQYLQEKKILSNLDFSFMANKKYLICGQSGSGKSTIISLVMGLRTPNRGSIIINGKNISNIDLEAYRSRIAIVSQDTFLFHDTILQNLTADNAMSEDDVMDVLRKVGLYDMVKALKNGVNTVLGDDGKTLSGGQRQRLAIARAMLKPSDVIIFDEPTSALDKETEELISNTIKCIEDKIVIIVSHSDCFADFVDEILHVS